MRWMDLSHGAPERNLALDEVLLDSAETGRAGDTLRFWESAAPFVVLGTAQQIAAEVQEAHCREDGVPIMRRCSAGGCVLQGPGCLNYTLALTFERFPGVRTLHGSYAYILGRIAEQLHARGVPADLAGISDLAVDGRKVSGNAQRRRRRAILHHGTLLYRPDHAGMERYLREPGDRPAYRGERAHTAFVAGIPLSRETLCAAVRDAFGVAGPPAQPLEEEVAACERLAREKYSAPEWIRRR